MKVDYKRLRRLANIAAKAQEQEHNDPQAPSANIKIERFEEYAKACGFEKVIWPGLYPVVVHVGGYHEPIE